MSSLRVRGLSAGLGLVVLSACGAGSTGSGAQGLASRGYLWASSTEVSFIQLTVTGATLSGTLDFGYLAGTKVTTQHGSFTGAENGQSVTLTFSQGFGTTTNLSGAVSSDSLVLNFPLASGEIQSITFAPSQVATYNAAILSLQQGASNSQAAQAAIAQSQAASAQSQAAAAQQVQLDAAVGAAAAKVVADISSLPGIGFGSNTTGRDLKAQQTDLGTMRADEVAAKAEPDPSTRCSDAYTVQSDAYTVQSDYYTVQSDNYGVSAEAGPIQSAMGDLTSDFGKLQQAVGADPSYAAVVPTEKQVNSAAAEAQQTINANVGGANTQLAQAKVVSDSALAEAGAFVKQYCG